MGKNRHIQIKDLTNELTREVYNSLKRHDPEFEANRDNKTGVLLTRQEAKSILYYLKLLSES